jgi:hypothetical protein
MQKRCSDPLNAHFPMQQRFLEHDGQVIVKLKKDKKHRAWRYENVTVWPEGIGAAACFVLDTGDYHLRVAGYEIDLQSLVEKYSERYAEWIVNNIIDGVFSGLRGIKSAILVGGGVTLAERHLRRWYGDKILDPRQHATTKRIHPVDMNAVGGVRFALMRMKQKELGYGNVVLSENYSVYSSGCRRACRSPTAVSLLLQ